MQNTNGNTPANNASTRRIAIADMTNQQLLNLEQNYFAKGVIKGGIFSLAEVRAEKFKRLANGLDGQQIFQLILDLSNDTADGFTAYIDLWNAIFPHQDWCGQHSVRIMMEIMHEAFIYCVENKLPIVTVLVVGANTRCLSTKAIKNIYESAHNLGVDVGLDANGFVEGQILKAFELFKADKKLH